MAEDSVDQNPELPKYERHHRVRARRSLEAIAAASEKFCPRCGQVRPKTDFTTARSRADGLHWCCRACVSRKAKRQYHSDLDKWRQISREQQQKSRERNPEAAYAASRKFRESERGAEATRAIARKAYHKDPQKYIALRREWEKKNPEKHAAGKKRWQERRQERDPVFRMIRAVRRRVAGVLSGQKNGRRTFDLLGYHPDELRAHVESLFTEGMSWDNYGEWHLDHDRPVASFDFDQEGAMQECWALSNLKPMWKAANHAKAGIWNGVNWGKVTAESCRRGWDKRRAKVAATGAPMAEGPPT